MSGYAYTYPDGTSYLDDLPEHVAAAGRAMLQADGDDMDLLRANTTLTGAEKALLAEKWGGPGAGEEFTS